MTSDQTIRQARLVAALRESGVYGHPVRSVELIETHISYVLLAGGFAYKVKKAVDLGFLDFTALDHRRFYCHEELRLNRRTAPQLYLEVVTVTGTARHPRLGGPGRPLEYAVKMRRFAAADLGSRLLEDGRLTAAHLDQAGRDLAAFHHRVAVAGAGSSYGEPAAAHGRVLDNFAALGRQPLPPDIRATLSELQAWSDATFARLSPVMARRRQTGFVRECHGDLHLGNLVLLDGALTPFDCIEFNPGLRWIDVMSEAAFLAMDLEDRGRADLAWRFLNGYLEQTGDYEGVALLAYYKAYRALVRAKVAGLRLAQDDVAAAERPALAARCAEYVALAARVTAAGARLLCITHGLSGAGKTAVARELAGQLGAVHLRSDVERKRLFGMEPEARSGAGVAQGMYSPAASRKTYERLAGLAAGLLGQGYPVVVDAAFLEADDRARMQAVARDCGVPLAIIAVEAPEAELHRRIAARAAAAADASEADAAVLRHQIARYQPLSDEERRRAVVLDTSMPLNPAAVARCLRKVAEPMR